MYKFQPILKSLIWGGEKIAPYKGIATDQRNIGESWELSGVKDNESVVAEGPEAGTSLPELIARHGAALLGKANYGRFGEEFPLLIKFIDARQDLSIQVHPNDALAWERHKSKGKTEMWYIVDCDPGAELLYGFKHEISKEEFAERIANNTLLEVTNNVPVHKGDVFFIESGTLHAIGKGILIAEIQQNSNTTYRIYDYGRVGKDGKPRELHVEKAKEVTNLVPPKYPTTAQGAPTAIEGGKETLLRSCEYFNVNKLELDGTTKLTAGEGSFNSLLVLDGAFEIAAGSEKAAAKKGDSLFITAGTGEYTVTGKGTIILTDII